jgi:hypothetical protein
MTHPDNGPGTDVDADSRDLGEHERPETSDPDAMRDDLPEDPNAATGPDDDSGGAG